MSVVQFRGAIDSSVDLQIWNNAACDNGEISEDLTGSRQSWGSLNPKASFDSVSSKENQDSAMESKFPPSLKSSSTPFKPVNKFEITEKSRIKGFPKRGFEENRVLKSEIAKEIWDKKKIDEEIEEIESNIFRLNSRLEDLRLEKAERGLKIAEKRGAAVGAKFMEQKQSVKIAEEKKRIEEISNLSARTKVNKRRGMSMGPTEIVKSRQLCKQEMITPLQSRRKSCFWKLEDVKEGKMVGKDKVTSSSVSPKSRKVATKARQAVTTIASRKTVKKEDYIISSIQPKKLFNDGEKSVSKKPLRPGRTVPSRYNQSTTQSTMRKRSLPENDNDNSKRVDKKRSLSAGKSWVNENEGKIVGRVKKKWEIPSEIVVHGSVEGEKSPLPIVDVPDLLPRLRIARGVKDSPRDSGPAKKAVELVGRKSFFSSDEDVEGSVCQALDYPDEEGGER